jgi:hypothetical protein
MFLDEKLYKCVQLRNDDIIKAADNIPELTKILQNLVNELYKICEDHFKPQFTTEMSYPECRLILDRTFNSWDFFIEKLKKENSPLTHLLENANYKKIFMENPELKNTYDRGKK